MEEEHRVEEAGAAEPEVLETEQQVGESSEEKQPEKKEEGSSDEAKAEPATEGEPASEVGVVRCLHGVRSIINYFSRKEKNRKQKKSPKKRLKQLELGTRRLK